MAYTLISLNIEQELNSISVVDVKGKKLPTSFEWEWIKRFIDNRTDYKDDSATEKMSTTCGDENIE